MTMTLETFLAGAEHEALSGDLQLYPNSPRVWRFDPDSSAHTVTLPDATLLRPGAPHFYLINISGSYSITFDKFGGTLFGVSGPGTNRILFLRDNSTQAGTWEGFLQVNGSYRTVQKA